MRRLLLLLPALLTRATSFEGERFDVVIRGGTVYDGTGQSPRRADVGIRGDRVASVGDLSRAEAATILDARGLAVAPGFINMLSWSTEIEKHQYSVGFRHVLVNGTLVLRDGEHTGALPGRALRGPGARLPNP